MSSAAGLTPRRYTHSINSHTVDPLLSANLLGVNFSHRRAMIHGSPNSWRGVDALQRPPGRPHAATGVSDGVLGLSQPPGAARPNGGAPPLGMFKIFSISYLHSLAWNAKKSIPTGTDNPVWDA
jgi:hypothetical protein